MKTKTGKLHADEADTPVCVLNGNCRSGVDTLVQLVMNAEVCRYCVSTAVQSSYRHPRPTRERGG